VPKDNFFSSILLTPRLHPLYGILMTNLLSLNQGLLFHGCGIMDKRRGYLFIGHSGSGKSTMAKLWLNEASVLGDEHIGVRKINAHFCVFPIFWRRIATNKGVALRKIFFLHHDSRNRVFKLSTKQAFLGLLKYSFCPVWHKKAMEGMLESCAELAQKIPCFSLHFIPDARVLELIREC